MKIIPTVSYYDSQHGENRIGVRIRRQQNYKILPHILSIFFIGSSSFDPLSSITVSQSLNNVMKIYYIAELIEKEVDGKKIKFKSVASWVELEEYRYYFLYFNIGAGNKRKDDLKLNFMRQSEIRVFARVYNDVKGPFSEKAKTFELGKAWLIEKLKKGGKFDVDNQKLIDKLKKNKGVEC